MVATEMTKVELMRHAQHMCDVYADDDNIEHVGVVEFIGYNLVTDECLVLVSGHPSYGERWLSSDILATSCKVRD